MKKGYLNERPVRCATVQTTSLAGRNYHVKRVFGGEKTKNDKFSCTLAALMVARIVVTISKNHGDRKMLPDCYCLTANQA
jgi:hypothetical protein